MILFSLKSLPSWSFSCLKVHVIVVNFEIGFQVVLQAEWLHNLRSTLFQRSGLLSADLSIVLPHVLSLIFDVDDISGLQNNRLADKFKFVILNGAISASIDSPNDCDEFSVTCIVAVKVQKGINLWMADVALSLAVN